jgi:hypothetical protein
MVGRDSYDQWETVTFITNGRPQTLLKKDNVGKRQGFFYYLLIISVLFTHLPRGAWESRTPEPAMQIETIF